MIPARFRKKPVEIVAMRWMGSEESWSSITRWVGPDVRAISCAGRQLAIETLEGRMVANPGDWVIRGIKGEYYPCKPDIFDATYEAVL